MSKLALITVVTNEKNNLDGFYNSLANQSFRDFTVYFVDNNSADGSAAYFKELNRSSVLNVVYIQLDYNSGFSGGCNIGAVKAIEDNCKYLFFSNNDLVFDTEALNVLIKTTESDSLPVCLGPLLFSHKQKNPGLIQEFGGKINFKRGTLKKLFAGEKIENLRLPAVMETDFIGGGVFFIKAEVFLEIGMFETSYFAYFDEIDISYRLKIIRNYKMIVVSGSKIWHNHNWVKKNNSAYYFEYYLSERNKFLFYRKYRMYWALLMMLAGDLVKFPWRLVWFTRVCGFKLGLYYLKGMFDGLLNKTGKPGFVK